MTALQQDQRFALLLILALTGGSCLFDITQAQTLTAEDRMSVLKFVGAFMNFLDMELENSTTTRPPTTGDGNVETTDLTTSDSSTEETTEASVTSGSTTESSESTEPGTITTTEVTTTTVRRRMCFKRFCYKFGSDKGYIV